MTRLTTLTAAAGILFAANSVLWASIWPSGPNPLDPGQGCAQAARALPSKDELSQTMKLAEFAESLPSDPCTGCSLVMDTTQTWCKYRPPNTECFTGPMFDNFRLQRPYRIYQCGALLGSCCGPWAQNGCCNDSYNQPVCYDDDTNFLCSEAPNCP